MIYIQRRCSVSLETVDCYDNRKDAKESLIEYRLQEPTVYFYFSSRPCKEWLINH